jgi:hypothetical protein
MALEARAFSRPGRRTLLWWPEDRPGERALRWLILAALVLLIASRVVGWPG